MAKRRKVCETRKVSESCKISKSCKASENISVHRGLRNKISSRVTFAGSAYADDQSRVKHDYSSGDSEDEDDDFGDETTDEDLDTEELSDTASLVTMRSFIKCSDEEESSEKESSEEEQDPFDVVRIHRPCEAVKVAKIYKLSDVRKVPRKRVPTRKRKPKYDDDACAILEGTKFVQEGVYFHQSENLQRLYPRRKIGHNAR